jgi:large subunit ribosomal protein L35
MKWSRLTRLTKQSEQYDHRFDHPQDESRQDEAMPKQKTHSGAKKRFKVTGSGKITHEQVNRRHLMEVKSGKRARKLESDQVVAKADVPRVKRMLGML